MQNNQHVINKIVSLKDDGVLEVSEIEIKVVNPIIQMYKLIGSIIKENNLINEG